MGPAKKKARTTTIELKGVPSDGRLHVRSSASWFRSGVGRYVSLDYRPVIGNDSNMLALEVLSVWLCATFHPFPLISLLECTLSAAVSSVVTLQIYVLVKAL